MTQSRQLAAIMFTDIVGCTSIMGSDETKADPDFKKVLAKAKRIHDTYLEKYGVIDVLD